MNKRMHPIGQVHLAVALCACVCMSTARAASITPEELAQVKAAEANRIAAVNQVYGAVVAIYPKSRQGGGSGVVYDSEGFALTNDQPMPTSHRSCGMPVDKAIQRFDCHRCHHKPCVERSTCGTGQNRPYVFP